jgi:hypothetical protein
MDPNITKKGLLALKDSKPVPITAHSHEIVVPCVYTETVKKMMKAKGIELPLSHAKLAELRKIAKATPGHYEPDKDDKAGGSSHAKGTMNVGGKKNQASQQIAKQTQKVQIFLDRRTGRKKTRRPRTTTSIPMQGPQMVNPPAYNTIRPFVANTPMGFYPSAVKSEESMRAEKEKDAAAQLLRDEALKKRTDVLEALIRRSEEVERNSQRHVLSDLISASPWSQPPTSPSGSGRGDFPDLEVGHRGPEKPEEKPEEKIEEKPEPEQPRLTKDELIELLKEIGEWPRGKGAQRAMEAHASQKMGRNMMHIGTTFDKSKERIEGYIRNAIKAIAEH